MRIKKNDTVIVIRGRDKGKTGKVLEVYPKISSVKVDGLNKVTKHKKPSSDKNKGGLFEEFMPINVSKVGLVHSSKKNLHSRVGYKIVKGEKKRILKSNGKEI